MAGVLKSRKTSGRIARKKKVCKPQDKSVARDKYLQKTYGITLAEYGKLANEFWGSCWLCQKPPKPGKNLHVDHNHVLAKTSGLRVSVRGVLCWYCNKKIVGRRRRETAKILLDAYNYLMSDRAQEILGG